MFFLYFGQDFRCLFYLFKYYNVQYFILDFFSSILMCLNNRISFNIQKVKLKMCFGVNSNAILGKNHIKWNKNNHSCTILNTDGSCMGSSIRVVMEAFLEIVLAIIYQVFLVTFKDHLTSFMQSYMIFIGVSYWRKIWGLMSLFVTLTL